MVMKKISTTGMNDAQRQEVRENVMMEAYIMKGLR